MLHTVRNLVGFTFASVGLMTLWSCASAPHAQPSSGSSGTAGSIASGGTTTSGGSAGASGGSGGLARGGTSSGGASSGGVGGAGPSVVDASTLHHKVMFGYQGWFAAPGDGSAVNRWHHWFRNNIPDAAHANVDLYPDLRELDADELFDTLMTHGSAPAKLYSAYTQKTVERHFKWMADNKLDGVFLQRFLSETQDNVFKLFRDEVTRHVMSGSEKYGRTFVLMYDGINFDGMVQSLEADWMHMVDDLGITASPRYLHHRNKPLVAIWGLGFSSYNLVTATQAAQLISWFQRDAPAKYQATVMGGVPEGWRTLTGSSQTDPAWANVYRSLDVISPWAVGRYADDAGADNYRTTLIAPDLVECQAKSIDYMPVIFPGFSWANMHSGTTPQNQIPRRGGAFYWHQAYNAVKAGVDTIYIAMFDEMDEGTAMFKVAPTRADAPDQGYWLTLDADGFSLPSDWYMRLADQTGRMLRGEIPVTAAMPISPP